MKIKNLSILLLFTFFSFSCTREIEIDTGEFSHKHVIEGYIENGKHPWVIITNNMEFFSTINLDYSDPNSYETLMKLFVLNAEVIVSDGITSETLKLTIDTTYVNEDYSWSPIKYRAENIVGEVGKTYSLVVNIGEKHYTASTTITEPYVLDSVWTVFDESTNNEYCWIHAVIHDDPNEANFYNCFSKRIGQDNYFTECLLCLWDDKFFNGQSFEATAYRGSAKTFSATGEEDNEIEDLEGFGKFKANDSVVLKVVTMDNASFNFWISQQSSPVVQSNINGGALGVWCGFGVHYTDTIVCRQ